MDIFMRLFAIFHSVGIFLVLGLAVLGLIKITNKAH
jgi:hypothetical protein